MTELLIIRFLTSSEQGEFTTITNFCMANCLKVKMRRQAPQACLEGKLGDEIRQHTSNHKTARDENLRILGR
jgi:hypothetical protein